MLAADPSQSQRIGRERLKGRLDTVEKRITELLNDPDFETPGREKRGNFYRLLGAYRGSSEALLDFAERGAKVDWTPWYEERFA